MSTDVPFDHRMETKPLSPTSASGEVRTVAVIDIGASAIRMRIAEIRGDGTIHSLDSLQHAVPLGKDTFTKGYIQQSSIEECVTILRGYRRVLTEYGITDARQIRAVATSAVREAENREAFLDRLFVATQIAVEAIEGPEESRLTYVAVQDLLEREPHLKQHNTAVVEVGGGSTEAIFMQAGRVTHFGSHRLGSRRMREALETYRAPADRVRAILDREIDRCVEQMQRTVPLKQVASLVALSGDARFAASLISPTWEKEEVLRVPVAQFAAVADSLSAVPVDELVRQHHIAYQEAETIGPALLAYAHLARAFSVEAIIITRVTLRDGLLKELSLRGAWTMEFAAQAIDSAMQLAARYHVDEEHALAVADLAVRLFRELQPEHNLDERYALLLRIAGILHEVGRYINDSSHHKHSMYIITNSELFGVTKRDLQIVGLLARYHRRAMPREYHTEYMALDHDHRLIVSKLAALLRVADALSRERAKPLPDLTFSREQNNLILTVTQTSDFTLERLALKQKANLFEQLFGLKLELRSATNPNDVIAHG
jgi:exopolyphosphatase/guanosine-5'-triphosphate,3'-diphosphate pyrophosphatase